MTTTDSILVRNSMTALEAAVMCLNENLSPKQAWDAGILDSNSMTEIEVLDAVSGKLARARQIIKNQ